MSFLIASWVRENDEPLFGRFFEGRPGLRVENARRGPVELAGAHGLLVTGGPDISAPFHNEPVADHSLILDAEPERDAWEFAAVRAALERGLPILCVCKGLQVLNVALGGTLRLHIEGHNLPEQRDNNLQSLRHAASARHRFESVNSSHHQALDRVPKGLEIESWSASDDVIEQVRLAGYPFCRGVQFHPERDLYYAPLFEDFIDHLDHLDHPAHPAHATRR